MEDKCTSFLLAVVFLALTSTALANTWYVNGVNGSDSNNCASAATACKTIGHAISLAASGDTIRVATATYTENLNINKSLTIVGSGAPKTIIDGGGAGRVAVISSGMAVSLSGLTIRNGSATAGGGIFNKGILHVIGITVTGNNVHTGCNSCGADGAGIYNSAGATLTMSSSTVSSNVGQAACSVGCFAGGGGIANSGRLTITKSTISGNGASVMSPQNPFSAGGGIWNFNGATLTMTNSTISGNSATSGGGIFNIGNSTVMISNGTVAGNNARYGGGIRNYSGTFELQNSIVANNAIAGNCYQSVTSNGYNLSSDSTCNFNGPGDLNNTDPILGPLQKNGGPTQTMARFG